MLVYQRVQFFWSVFFYEVRTRLGASEKMCADLPLRHFLDAGESAPFFPIPFGWWRPFPDTPITIISSCFSHGHPMKSAFFLVKLVKSYGNQFFLVLKGISGGSCAGDGPFAWGLGLRCRLLWGFSSHVWEHLPVTLRSIIQVWCVELRTSQIQSWRDVLTHLHWLVVSNMIFIFHFIYGMSCETHWLSLHHFSEG